MNICLIKAFYFFQQFCLVVQHKPGKKHIIPYVFNKSANTNNTIHGSDHFKLNNLIIYHMTLVEINPNLEKRILDGHTVDNL